MKSETPIHPPITDKVLLDEFYASQLPDLKYGKVARVKIVVEPNDNKTSQTNSQPNPLWCIVFRNSSPLSFVFKWRGSMNETTTLYIPIEDTPLYVTHWEQIGDSMKQLDLNK